MRHQGKQLLFVLLGVADLALTWWLLAGSDGAIYEANPVARWWLDRFGWGGLAGFKAGAVTTVLVAAWGVGRSRPEAAGRVLSLACAVTALVVVYSCTLTRAAPPSPAEEIAQAYREDEARAEADRPYREAVRRREEFWGRLVGDLLADRCALREAAGRLAASEESRQEGWRGRLLLLTPGRPLDEAMAACVIRHAIHSEMGNPSAAWQVALRLERQFRLEFGGDSPVNHETFRPADEAPPVRSRRR